MKLFLTILVYIILTGLLPIRLAAADDTIPPQLQSLTISPTSVNTFSQDQTVTISGHLTDNLSGVAIFGVTVRLPSGTHVGGGVLSPVSGTSLDGIYIVPVDVTQSAEHGTWHIETISFRDNVGNIVDYSESQLIALGYQTTFQVTNEITVPGPPLNVFVVPGDESATVFFRGHGSNGGSPITSYTVTSSPENITAVGSLNGIMVTGLTNGVAYTFTITATNIIGSGAASAPSDSVTPSSSAAPSYKFNRAWGAFGSASGQFNAPWDVKVDTFGNLYVADAGNNRIQKFDTNGNFITQWGSYGTGTGQFNGPRGVAVDSAGNVYVSDTSNSRIQKFDSNGNYLKQWGSFGIDNGQFAHPSGIAIDASGNIYVAEEDNHRIQKFDYDGNYITQWGSGILNYGTYLAMEVAVDSTGNVYVVDPNNSHIQKFDSNGNFVSYWGSVGIANGQFDGPMGIATDSLGNVFVADQYNNRIQKFDPYGNYIAQWGSGGSLNGQFNGPNNVAVDQSGNVYIADEYNNRIQKFSLAIADKAFAAYYWRADETVINKVNFDASTSYCPNGLPDSCAYAWNFGDGTISGPASSANMYISHTYGSNTPVTVTLTVNNQSAVSHTVTPSGANQKPIAAGLLSTYPGTTPIIITNSTNNVTFTDASSDPDGNGTIKTVKVNWGDGYVDTQAVNSIFTHNYSTRAATYTITHVVYDNGNLSNFEKLKIKIAPPKFVLSGTVTSGGSPLSGVTVAIKIKSHTRAVSKSDSNGAYAFPALSAGNYTLGTYKSGYTCSNPGTISLTGNATQDITCTKNP